MRHQILFTLKWK